MHPTILLWFRTDLRLHDHEALCTALERDADVVPVYVFDPRMFGRTRQGFPRTAGFRAQFLREAVEDLRQQLRQRGADLIVRTGHPEQVLPDLTRATGARQVFFHRCAGTEEQATEAAVAQALRDAGATATGFDGHTLYHPHNLPFSLQQLPEVFTEFRRRIENNTAIREPFATPDTIPYPPDDNLPPGPVPTCEELGVAPCTPDPRAVLDFKGGETAGLGRLKAYFWQQDCLRRYKETRNGLLGADYSSKFSPWLALGCLSPRYIYAEVERYERQVVRNDSTYWLVFELLWRDFFHFLTLKHGGRLFRRSSLRNLRIDWQRDETHWQAWIDGHTGFPLIDANMRELAATGFMSNRGRQNVASFLTKNLGLDWLRGAEWFEGLLIDYDPASNYGNWSYAAAVGTDPRGFRFFNPIKQGKDYDPQGDYIRHWLPELARVPANRIHEPWLLSADEQARAGMRLGVDYPRPVVDLFASAAENEKRYEKALLQAGLRTSAHPSRIRRFVKK